MQIDTRPITPDLRAHERVSIDVPAEVLAGGSSFEAWVANVSIGGAFVAAEAAPPLGETVELSFVLPGDDGPVHALGEIVYRNPARHERSRLHAGFGVKLREIDARSRDRIRAFVVSHNARRDRFGGGLIGLTQERLSRRRPDPRPH